MIANIISSKVLIARVFDKYNIDYSGFVARVPNWVYFAMRELDLQVPIKPEVVEGTVVNYKVEIPTNTYKLYGVSYEGYRLPCINPTNQMVNDDMPNLIHTTAAYELGPGYIITSFEEGTVKFYIDSLPVEYDENSRIYFPLIPDNEEVFIAIEWYIILRLITRGHKVGEFSLSVNNEFLNPAMAWELSKKKARNSVTIFTNDEREVISNMINTFLSDRNYHTSVNFNPYHK